TVGARETRRLQQAIETAWDRGHGRAELRTDPSGPGGAGPASRPVARGLVCPSCARSFEPARPGLFSYNSPLGACESCRGFGRIIQVDWDKVIPDSGKSIAEGAIRAWNGNSSEHERAVLARYCKKKKIPTDVPWEELSAEQKRLVIDGEGTWDGGK